MSRGSAGRQGWLRSSAAGQHHDGHVRVGAGRITAVPLRQFGVLLNHPAPRYWPTKRPQTDQAYADAIAKVRPAIFGEYVPRRPANIGSSSRSERRWAVLPASRSSRPRKWTALIGLIATGESPKLSGLLGDALRHLDDALSTLGTDGDHATASADAAIAAQHQLETACYAGMVGLLGVEDRTERITRRELYRRFSRIGEAVVDVAERIVYAVVKQS